MRRASLFLSLCFVLVLLMGCNQGSTSPQVANSSAQVSLSITDQPPNGVTVLFFQIDLTAAYLTPSSGAANVSLLSNNTPIQIDVTELQALSAFLSTQSVAGGTYQSLTLSFANPLLVIFNASGASIGTCAAGSVCQLTPPIDNNSGTITLSSAPFPLTLSDSTPIGLLVDFI